MKRRASRSALPRAVRASSRAGKPSRGSQRRPRRSQAGKLGPASAKYSRRCARDLRRRVQQGQDVDEAKQLDLDRLVVHGPFHQALVPPARAEEHGPGGRQPREDVAAVIQRQGFEIGHGHLVFVG